LQKLSIVIPAKNEAGSVGSVVAALKGEFPEAEVIVVDDGSTDATGALAASAGARVIRHPISRGNGAAIKSGARAASGEFIAFMDADGQHAPGQLARLVEALDAGYDLVVGARGRGAQASWLRWLGNSFYNRLASYLVGHPVADLTSGFRAARAERFREFLNLLPNGFSYPTTSTMAFFRAGYGVTFVPVEVGQRVDKGTSHIRLFRDGSRFLLIIFRVATLYSPLKLFAPLSGLVFLGGCGWLTMTLATTGRFTLFSGLLLITSLLIFLIGLVSEQITQLLYARREDAT
jgi:glycosyltransferase involved in cell wall biosynthesis